MAPLSACSKYAYGHSGVNINSSWLHLPASTKCPWMFHPRWEIAPPILAFLQSFKWSQKLKTSFYSWHNIKVLQSSFISVSTHAAPVEYVLYLLVYCSVKNFSAPVISHLDPESHPENSSFWAIGTAAWSEAAAAIPQFRARLHQVPQGLLQRTQRPVPRLYQLNKTRF